MKLPEPEKYTSHCIRQTSAIIYADTGATEAELMRFAKWQSATIARGYVEDSIANKRKVGEQITSAVMISLSAQPVDTDNTYAPSSFAPVGPESGFVSGSRSIAPVPSITATGSSHMDNASIPVTAVLSHPANADSRPPSSSSFEDVSNIQSLQSGRLDLTEAEVLFSDDSGFYTTSASVSNS